MLAGFKSGRARAVVRQYWLLGTVRGSGNRVALGYVLTAALGYSFIPLVVDWGEGGEAPFFFNSAWRAGFTVACLAFLLSIYRRLFLDARVWSRALPKVFVWAMVFAVISHMDSTFFTLSLGFVDVSVAAILFETWPILMVLLIVFLFRDEDRYQRNMLSVVPLMLMGFVGFGFVVISQFGGFSGDYDFVSLLLGVGLAVVGAGVSSLGAFTFRWGADLSSDLEEVLVENDRGDGGAGYSDTEWWNAEPVFDRQESGLVDKDDEYALNMFGVVLGQTIANLLAVPVNAGMGVAFSESISTQSLLIAFVGGVLCNGVANIFWRRANVVTTNLGVNAVAYATPIFSLVWLALFWHIDVARADFLLIGAMSIVSANILINFESEVRWGNQGSGARAVVLRDLGLSEESGRMAVDRYGRKLL